MNFSKLTNLIQVLLLLTLSFFSCQKTDPAKTVFTTLSNNLQQNKVISYDYDSQLEYYFNGQTYTDSAKIIYFQLDSSLFDFGFHARYYGEEYLFDGFNLERLNHPKKLKVRYNQNDFINDSTYFYDFRFFNTNPFRLPKFIELDTILKATINDELFFIYKKEKRQTSKSDSTQIVVYQKFYYVSNTSNELQRIKEITIRSNDTLAVSNVYFKNYQYEKMSIDLKRFAQFNDSMYRKITAEEEENDFEWAPIKVGEKIKNKTYVDFNNEKIDLFGNPKKKTFLLFSFIGCAACEIALKDLQVKNYDFKENIDFYYTSFQDEASVLKKYFDKKEFPFQGFSKEGNLMKDFSLYTSPSFVLINSNGKVEYVEEGYDDDVKKVLEKILF